MLARLRQPLKALTSMLVTLLGIVMLVSNSHLSNACCPMPFTGLVSIVVGISSLPAIEGSQSVIVTMWSLISYSRPPIDPFWTGISSIASSLLPHPPTSSAIEAKTKGQSADLIGSSLPPLLVSGHYKRGAYLHRSTHPRAGTTVRCTG